MRIKILVPTIAAMLIAAGSAFAYTSADLLISAKTSTLGNTGDAIVTWGSPTLTAVSAGTGNPGIKTPTVATLLNATTGITAKWAKPAYTALGGANGVTTITNSTSGLTSAIYRDGIANTGFTVVAAVRPELNTLGSTDFRSIVNLYLGGVGLYIKDSGIVSIRLQTTQTANLTYNSTVALVDATPVVMSMVVSSTGHYEVWAGSQSILSGNHTAWPTTGILLPSAVQTPTSALSNRNSIGLGSQGGTSSPGSSTFRGYIGDTYVYKTALTDTERLALVSDVQTSMGMVAVPEPGSIVALLMGMGGLVGFSRRKK